MQCAPWSDMAGFKINFPPPLGEKGRKEMEKIYCCTTQAMRPEVPVSIEFIETEYSPEIGEYELYRCQNCGREIRVTMGVPEMPVF